MDPILLQKQVRDNAEDVRSFLSDLKNWQTDMKRKDDELRGNSSENQSLPPVRNKMKRSKHDKHLEKTNGKASGKQNRILSSDYSSWDKFDVEKACEEVDLEKTNSDLDDNSEQPQLAVGQESLREEAVYEKEMGNEYVKRQKWKDAIICYSRAIECYPYDAIFYANRALCYLKTSNLKSAESDCTVSLQLDDTYVKAYQRRAAARTGLDQLEGAKSDLLKVLDLEPQNSASRSELAKLEQKINTKTKSLPKNNKSSAVQSTPSKDSNSSSNEAVSDQHQVGGGDFTPSLKESCSNIVQPLHKPPHLRSKRLLKRINIQEISNETMSVPTEDTRYSSQPSGDSNNASSSTQCDNIKSAIVAQKNISLQNNSKPSSENNMSNDNNSHLKSKPQKHALNMEDRMNSHNLISHKQLQNAETIDSESSEQQLLPPIPKSSVQFLVVWKRLKFESRLRFLYLKQIPGKYLPQIFQDSLESDIFSEILHVLKTDFLQSNEEIYSYILGLSNVRRFTALTMFLSKTDKEGIKQLLDHCEKCGECSQEEALMLSKKYEL